IYFSSGVIEGMLTAIGIIIIKKELPHAIGYDTEHEGDFFSYQLLDTADKGFLGEIIHSFNYAHIGAIIVTVVSIIILVAFNKVAFLKKIKLLPGALVVVIAGILINEIFKVVSPSLVIAGEHLVKLPTASSASEFFSQFTLPDLSAIGNPAVWLTA